jgi:hypothetical protein
MIRLKNLLLENIYSFLTKHDYYLLVSYLKGDLNSKDKTDLISLVTKLQNIKHKHAELQTKPFDKAYRIDTLPINKIPVPLMILDVEYGGVRYGHIFGGKNNLQLAKLDYIPFESKSELTGWTIDKDFAFEMLYDTSRDNDFQNTVPVMYEIDYNAQDFIFDVDFLEKIRSDETGYGYESEVLRLSKNKPLPGYLVYTDDIIPDYDASGIDTPGDPTM